MALLAYVAPANAFWETAYGLTNVVHNETSARTPGALSAEAPRVGPPSQHRHWCGFPDFLRLKWGRRGKWRKIDALAAKKQDEPCALKPASGAMRLLTWNRWGDGPLFHSRLRAAVRAVSEIRPTILVSKGFPHGGSDFLKAAPPWRRLVMRDIESPYL